MIKLSVLDYLRRMIDKTLTPEMFTHMRYPTPVSKFLKMNVTQIELGSAVIEIKTSTKKHGNQQGTIHGGLISELADAAIGTAHSTFMSDGESFTTIELKINFYRPVFDSLLTAKAGLLHKGKTISHYICEITRADGKIAAIATSTVMTLTGEKAKGR